MDMHAVFQTGRGWLDAREASVCESGGAGSLGQMAHEDGDLAQEGRCQPPVLGYLPGALPPKQSLHEVQGAPPLCSGRDDAVAVELGDLAGRGEADRSSCDLNHGL